MKAAIVAFNSLKFSPYVRTYSEWLDGQGIEYDVIYPDRAALCESLGSATYRIGWNQNKNKIFNFLKFTREAKKILKKNRYDFVFVMTTFPAVLLSGFLSRHYKGRYLVDVRDYTYEDNGFYFRRERKVLKNAAMRVISAPGFKNFLPDGEYVFCPNISEQYRCGSHSFKKNTSGKLTIGYVGTIAYPTNCKKLIDSVRADDRFRFEFFGNENGAQPVGSYIKELDCDRIVSHGAYVQAEKAGIIESVDLLFNVYGNERMLVKHALSNKLYDSMYFKKPLLVSPDTEMANEGGDFAYSCDFSENMLDGLISWYSSLSAEEFDKYGDEYVKKTYRELDEFYKAVKKTVIGE